MNFFDMLDKSFLALGSAVVGSAQDIKHGSFFNADYVKGMIFIEGNPKHATMDLKDAGVEAWGEMYLNDGRGAINVKPKNKERALRELRRRGYECWPGWK